MNENLKNILTIDLDETTIVDDPVFSVQMADILLTEKEHEELSQKFKEICGLLLQGIVNKNYSMQDKEADK